MEDSEKEKRPWLFQKGKSGNPKGRPRKGKSFNDIFLAELGKMKQEITDPKTGKSRVIDGKTAMCLAYIRLAFHGESEGIREKALDRIMTRIDGPIIQQIELSGSVEQNGTQALVNMIDINKLSPEETEALGKILEKSE
mgnify:CR=1 FL=1